MDCLNQIIGLSRTQCECITDQLPSGSDEIPDYNESESGVFLDELEGINLNVASGGDDCASGGIWERMDRARENAILDFKRNLLGCVGQKYTPKLKNFTWQLSQSTFSGTLTSITGSRVGMRISPMQLKGGFIYIKRIGVIINESAPVTLQVWNNINGGTLVFENSSTPLNTNADVVTWATLATPLELPMWDSNGHYIRYYVLIVMDGTFKPKGNKIDCGCAGARRPWDQWMEVAGTSGSDTSDLAGFKHDGKYTNGITLDVDVKCKSSEVICSDEFPLDFDEDGGAMNMAVAVQLRAGARLYEELLASDNINRFTMLNREQIAKYVDRWNEQYQAAIVELCEDIHIDANDCLMCKTTKTSIQKNLIRA